MEEMESETEAEDAAVAVQAGYRRGERRLERAAVSRVRGEGTMTPRTRA